MFIRTNELIPDRDLLCSRTGENVSACNQRQMRARRGLTLFFPLLIALSTLCYWLIIVKHDTLAMSLFMWTPGSAALLTRLIRREKFPTSTIHLHKRLWAPLTVALLIPLAIGQISYGLAWKTGITPLNYFHPSATVASLLSVLGSKPPLLVLALIPIFIAGAELIGATGEELGWRGYMLTRLIDAGVPRPILVSGIIWSLWHWPLILLAASSGGQPQIVTASIFLITITSLGCISAQLRLTSGSLWPSILLHAAWNGLILEIFDALTRGADTSPWTGEAGLITASVTLLIALIMTQLGKNTKNLKSTSSGKLD